MTDPFNYFLAEPPVSEILDHQTEHQLHRNYAQGSYSVYELTDDQISEIITLVLGTGSAYTQDWVPGRPVTINGERLLWVKRRGEHTKIVMTLHP